jgi:hypothetical protein
MRRYLLQFCDECSLNVTLCDCPEGTAIRTVATIDERDIEPLVEAAQDVVNGSGRLNDLAKLRAALQPFEEGK